VLARLPTHFVPGAGGPVRRGRRGVRSSASRRSPRPSTSTSYTAPIGSAFIAGFFAPWASYLVGGLAAFASFLFQAIAFNTGAFSAAFVGAKDATGAPIDPNVIASQVLYQAATIGVLSGAFFAAAAAWYRRFLRTANPNRSQPPPSSGKRPDGKVPKPNQGRPLLARRRWRSCVPTPSAGSASD
jgi:hypothetical protein